MDPLRDTFDSTRQPQPQRQTPDVALVIDQGDGTETPGYLTQLGKQIEALRSRGVAIVWMTMHGDRDTLNRPEEGDGPRDPKSLAGMGFDDPENVGSPEYAEFMEKYGPRKNDVILEKMNKSGFTEQKDWADNQDFEDVLRGNFRADAWDSVVKHRPVGDSLPDYFEDKGYKNVYVLGSVAQHCIAENAASVVTKVGGKATIVSSGVVSRHGEAGDGSTYWRDGSKTSEEWNEIHKRNVQNALAEMAKDKRRGYSAADIAAINSIDFVTNDDDPILSPAPAARQPAPVAPAPIPT